MFHITLRKAVPIDTATSQRPLGIFIFKQTGASTSGRMHTACGSRGGSCLLSGHGHTLGGHPGTTAQPASVQGGEGLVIPFGQSRGWALSLLVCLSVTPAQALLLSPDHHKMLLSVQLPSHSVPPRSPPLCHVSFRMIFQGTRFICKSLWCPAHHSSSHFCLLPWLWPLGLLPCPPMKLAPLPMYLSGLNFLSPQLFLF